MAVIAQKVPELEVTVVDEDVARIAAWNEGPLPVFEPGLEELLAEVRGRNLFFSADLRGPIAAADIVFVAVNTPTKEAGIGAGAAVDLRHVEAVARLICEVTTRPKIVVEKSTLPVRTAEAIQQILAANCANARCQVLSNPEFLSEGSALKDLYEPDRVLIGGEPTEEGELAVAALASIYARWIPRSRIFTTGLWSAELSKLAANAFLAQRVSSVNAVASLCEQTGADVCEVAGAVGTDSRIGPKYLNASLGFGGSCLEKDILNLVYLCDHHNLPGAASYWLHVVELNRWQTHRFATRIVEALFNTVAGKRIAVLGFAFKRDTDDCRESPAIRIVRTLLEEQAEVAVYDPRVPSPAITAAVGRGEGAEPNLILEATAAKAAAGAHAIVIATDWAEFRSLDYASLHAAMAKPAFLFDGRNLLDPQAMRDIGFRYQGVGR